ncbi:MAG: S41 family peptidase [Saprospiraceae bacterium]
MSETIRTYKIWEPFLLSVVTIVGMIAGAKFVKSDALPHKSDPSISSANYSGRQVEEIIRFLETKYVGEVSGSELSEKAIKAILEGLDPHTHYFPPEQTEELEEKTMGQYVGIGVEVLFIEDSLVILYPKKDSPAEHAGILSGDHVIAIDGLPIVSDTMDHMKVLAMIKGSKGSHVKLLVKPLLSKTLKTVEINRDDIKVPSVLAGYMIDSTTAFIKLSRFTNTTYREFMDSWEALTTKQHAKQLILDLRDNPGGYLREAVNILSQMFNDEGKLLVYTQGKNQERIDYKSTGKVFFPFENICVLINGNSASASEIVAGCLQDQDRAVILGTRSYGKGLVQEQFDLSNGGTLRMTVSKYYTPSGRLIQKAYDKESEIDTVQVFKTTSGRIVHAGGGITPDIIISDGVNWEDNSIRIWMDIISEYSINYDLTKYGGSLVNIDSVDQIRKDLPDHTTIMRDLSVLAKLRAKENYQAIMDYYDAHKDVINRITDATLIAYRTDEEGWYRAFNWSDPMVLKAKEIVKGDMQKSFAQH